MTKQFGEPSHKGFKNIIFKINTESDDETLNKNELDV